MLRVTLSRADEDVVHVRYRDPTLTPRERDRLAMLRLSALGYSPPQIAARLNYHPETVRRLLKRVQREGIAAVRQRRTGPPPDAARHTQVVTALDGLLQQDRTWTARQLATALGEQGIILSTRQTRRYLTGMRARWRRTTRTLKHKQDPVRAAQAAHSLAAFKKKRRQDSCASSSSTSAASLRASQ